ncbi:hypothetical protein BK809_0006101 [Diplodia seriata]|uniref:Uncharacterized protein n=1 Tax=Diplodia seriata TaxID=420778 RepID=A0A1S8B310_9PEZI|nr:hypothetical protein BK809_0006101 [Diplodia seriata]
MKTIAVMTLIYLPGSYIATIFGMNFFNFSSSGGLEVSDMFWLYWVLMVALTLVTVGTWMMWQGRNRHTRKQRMPNESQESSPYTRWNCPDWVRIRRRKGPEITANVIA